jgi:penicillin-binding protein 2
VSARLPVSAEHLSIVRDGMLAATIDTDGTAGTGVPAGVRIGGKTGTAEFGQPYPDGQFDTHGWYIAFAPYDEPQIAVAVYLEYGVGQMNAGPVAKEILGAYFDAPERQVAR